MHPIAGESLGAKSQRKYHRQQLASQLHKDEGGRTRIRWPLKCVRRKKLRPCKYKTLRLAQRDEGSQICSRAWNHAAGWRTLVSFHKLADDTNKTFTPSKDAVISTTKVRMGEVRCFKGKLAGKT